MSGEVGTEDAVAGDFYVKRMPADSMSSITYHMNDAAHRLTVMGEMRQVGVNVPDFINVVSNMLRDIALCAVETTGAGILTMDGLIDMIAAAAKGKSLFLSGEAFRREVLAGFSEAVLSTPEPVRIGIGDVVQLKHGGPLMTVVGLEGASEPAGDALNAIVTAGDTKPPPGYSAAVFAGDVGFLWLARLPILALDKIDMADDAAS